VIHQALGRAVPIELSSDLRVRGRVTRLALVSIVALGLVLGLATTLRPTAAILVALALGWATMPAVLAWSLVRPAARYLLAVPASLVTLGLLAICVTALPPASVAATGWLLMTAGVLIGGGLGIWFWYRAIPVPAALEDPFGRGRWMLIAVHVSLVVVGWGLTASTLLA
jgi:hypothetical protein